MIKVVASIDNLNCCASLGILDEEQIKQIKEAGVKRFNHNINTSKSYYKEICTTHNFEDRINVIKLLKKYDIEICSGIILGMDESKEDRIDMALSLMELEPKTCPINILDPIKGTKLESYTDKIKEDDIIRTICIFRTLMPKVILRFAGGRTRLSDEMQKLCMKAGINGMLSGDYLTTKGTKLLQDKKLIKSYANR